MVPYVAYQTSKKEVAIGISRDSSQIAGKVNEPYLLSN